MGYQSFGSKNSEKKTEKNINKVEAYRSVEVDRIVQNSIQEFLDETKSIEDDLRKLKQLSVEKSKFNIYNSNELQHKYASRIPFQGERLERGLQSHFNSFSRNRGPKNCRSVDHSVEKDALANHLNKGILAELHSNCKKFYI